MINIIKTLYLKYFELTSAICATLIIVLAVLMEKLLYLNAKSQPSLKTNKKKEPF